jgi:hypothetical protein
MADYSQNTKNVSPYFDDFDATKNFMRVIFNPSRAVQTRELTTLQTILSGQITSFADHIFKDGSSIIGGSVSVDNKAPFVVIATGDLVSTADDTTPFSGTLNNPHTDDGLIGMHFKQGTTNAIGKVVQVDDLSGTLRLHMEMHSGAFEANGTVAYQIATYDMNEIDEFVLAHWQTQTSGTHVTVIGNALKASVTPGVVYINGVFVTVVESDIIWVNAAAATGDYTVGFLMEEDDISSGEDASLADPASGLNNGAPGANRWTVNVQLAAYSLAATPPTNYYQIMRYETAVLVEKQEKVQYADIMEMLARRTHDESGSYVTKQFSGDVVVFDGSNFKYRISAGKAYINGYEQEKIAPSTVAATKARTTRTLTAEANASQYGIWVEVTDASSDVDDLFDHRAYDLVHLMTGTGGTGTSLGTARVVYIENTSTANTILIYLGDSLTLATDLETCLSLAVDNAGSPSTAKYANIASWAGTVSRFQKNTPVIELPNSPVQEVTSATYQTTLRIERTMTASGFTLVAGGSDLFVDDEIVAVIRVSDGVMFDVSTAGVFGAGVIGGSGSGTLTISGSHSLTAGTYDFLVRVTRPAAGSRVKTLTAEDQGGGGTFDSDANGVITFDGLGDWPEFYDVTYIELIEEDPAGTPIDVTNDGVLHSGQKNYYYGYSSISGLKASTAYRVKLHHWVHTGTGDYFSADSYAHGSDDIFLNWGGDDGDVSVDGAAYYNIPTFTNEERTRTFDLRNCLDFRRNIVEVNASTIMEIIEPNSSVTVHYAYWLPRIDKVWIDTTGLLGVTEGIAEEIPSPPPDLSNTITLFEANVGPYIFGPGTASSSNAVTEVQITAIDHRNYTMRDIGRLESRLKSLEYYTSENQLNSEAYSEDIIDVNGNLKSKSGIFVEKFVDHRNGQTSDPGYRCSMDARTGMMRSPYEMNRIGFQPDPFETQAGINEGAHTYTLAYTAVSHIEQIQENECMNINPFAVAIWAGTIEMDPKSDDWVDTVYLPALQLNDPVLEAQLQALYDRDDVGIPMWGEWETTIIGVSREQSMRDRWPPRSNWRPGEIEGVRETTIIENTTIQSERTGTILEQSGTQTISVDYGERVVDVSMIPFMRTIDIGFTADGLKPETAVIPYFADLDITADVVLDTAKTDQTGRITGIFTVPEQTFRTGINVFQLQDSPTLPLTFAATEFAATGILQTKQQSILSVEAPVFTTRQIGESIRSQNQEIIIETDPITQWYDPLAQTFLVEDEGGVFLDSVEIFFCSKDRYVPVTLQIVETATGLPTQTIVPFGSVTKRAADIMATDYEGLDDGAGSVTGTPYDPIFRYNGDHYYALDHGSSDQLQFADDLWTGDVDGYTATTFQFTDPVYLKENTEYAIVLLSNSNNYNVRVATLGTIDNVSGNAISSQPYMGSLLKSQNASTWTPDQQRDLMFRINRCNFGSAGDLYLRTAGTVDYWNSAITYDAANLTEVIFDNGTRHQRWLCIVDTLAAESPTTDPAKWQLITRDDGQHDVSLLNINYEEMLLPTTGIASQYKFTGDSLATFQNKVNIQLDVLDVVELYTEDTDGTPNAWNAAAPNVVDLKMVMSSSNVKHSPVIAKGRTSAVLVNNLVVTADAGDTTANFDAGEYQSRSVLLREASTDLRVLLDILNFDENADQPSDWESVVVKYRTTKKTLRYVERDTVPTKPADVDLKDNICYVHWINDTLVDPASAVAKINHDLTGANFTPRGQVVIDGFDLDASPQKVYLSSIADPDDFVVDGSVGTGTNPWTLVTTEPDIVDGEIFVWNSAVTDNYVSGDYAIESHNLYVANTTTTSQPSLNSDVGGDWTKIPSVMTQDVTKEDTDSEWVKMLRTTTPPADFDITSQYYEHEFEPMITPSEEFDNFAIKIEMYSNDEIKVPQVRRLRAIAAT